MFAQWWAQIYCIACWTCTLSRHTCGLLYFVNQRITGDSDDRQVLATMCRLATSKHCSQIHFHSTSDWPEQARTHVNSSWHGKPVMRFTKSESLIHRPTPPTYLILFSVSVDNHPRQSDRMILPVSPLLTSICAMCTPRNPVIEQCFQHCLLYF